MDPVATSSSTADSTPAAAGAGGSGRSGRRGRSGNGGGRSRTPRKETGGQAGSSRQQQQHSTSQDESDVWETPALGDERKEALNVRLAGRPGGPLEATGALSDACTMLPC